MRPESVIKLTYGSLSFRVSLHGPTGTNTRKEPFTAPEYLCLGYAREHIKASQDALFHNVLRVLRAPSRCESDGNGPTRHERPKGVSGYLLDPVRVTIAKESAQSGKSPFCA